MRPIVIQISSDPELESASSEAPAPKASLSAQAVVPLVTFLNTRDARGESARRELEAVTVERYAGSFVHLRLIRAPDREDPPLGWVVSRAARETIEDSLTAPENVSAIAQVLAALHARP